MANNQHMNFVQRALNPVELFIPTSKLKGDMQGKDNPRSISTHAMANFSVGDKFWLLPLIVQKRGENFLTDYTDNSQAAVAHARKTGEYFEFNTQKELNAYESGYKKGTALEGKQ